MMCVVKSELEKQMELLPDDDYFDSLPTWTKLEQYFQVSLACI